MGNSEGPTIRITSCRIIVSENCHLAGKEWGMLELLRDRLHEGSPKQLEPVAKPSCMSTKRLCEA